MAALFSLLTIIYGITNTKAEDDGSLLSVFFGNTGVGRWWTDPYYEELADAQIASLNALDVDTLCLTEISTQKLVDRFTDGLIEEYPYIYFPERERRGTDEYQCNCSTALYQATYSCLNETIAAGEMDYSPCFGVTRPPNHCLLCWTAYFEETVGLESIEVCDGGNYTQPPGPPSEGGECVYGDGQMNAAIFSKYPLSSTSSLIFSEQSLMYNGVVSAEIVKNDVSYHLFCTGFANWRHLDVMKGQAAELSDYVNDIADFEDADTVVLLLGDFNAGEQGECVECIDYPENDNGTIWNTILDINDGIYSIYENNFNEDGATIPRCTSCADNPRNDDDPDYVEYIGVNAFGFMGDNYESTEFYMAKRGWVDDMIESLNTSLTDKYGVIIYGQLPEVMVSTESPIDSMGSTEEPGSIDEDGVIPITPVYMYSVFVLFAANLFFA